jgi:hypothetical protein
MLVSMVALAPTWWDGLHAELPNILRDPNAGYDTYGVFSRFPRHLPAPLGEPRTSAGLWLMLGLAVAGLAYAATERRKRLLVFATAALLVSSIVDVWCSYVGDAIEVNRHLVGPLARLSVTAIIAIALGIDTLAGAVARRRAVTIDA